MQLVLLVTLATGAVHSAADTTSPPASGDTAVERGEQRYREGQAQFAAADYRSAISTWTKLLSELPADASFDQIRIDLLYNIAVAHLREYEFDKDRRHLLQARTLFARYGEARPGNADVQERLAEVDAKLAALEEDEGDSDAAEETVPPPTAAPVETPKERRDTSEPETPSAPWMRSLGIGLTAAGGAFVVGGVGLVVAGSRFRPAAEDQISILDEMNVPEDDPSRDEADAFLDDETRRGRTLMISGGALLGVGAVATGVGIWALIRGRRSKSGAAAALRVLPRRDGVTLTGRF